ncbi:Formin-like protein 5, partial [Nymphaea thermarum]
NWQKEECAKNPDQIHRRQEEGVEEENGQNSTLLGAGNHKGVDPEMSTERQKLGSNEKKGQQGNPFIPAIGCKDGDTRKQKGGSVRQPEKPHWGQATAASIIEDSIGAGSADSFQDGGIEGTAMEFEEQKTYLTKNKKMLLESLTAPVLPLKEANKDPWNEERERVTTADTKIGECRSPAAHDVRERHWALPHLALSALGYVSAQTSCNQLWRFVLQDAALSFVKDIGMRAPKERFMSEFKKCPDELAKGRTGGLAVSSYQNSDDKECYAALSFVKDIGMKAPKERFMSEFKKCPDELAKGRTGGLAALVGIPFAFKRLDALFFMGTLGEEMINIKASFITLEAACEEPKGNCVFRKLLGAVQTTGNCMNDGTFCSSAQDSNLTHY